MISVVILTFNEEINIAECVKSAKELTSDVVVLDSFSTDKTCQICESMGVKIIQNPFEGYASQRNFALERIVYQSKWLIMLDADERFDNELIKSIKKVNLDDHVNTMYTCRRKDFFLGGWLKRSSGYPSLFPRLFKLGHCRVEREINEEYYTSGSIGRLDGHLLHYPFNKGVKEWFHKHNNYSSLEAECIYRNENTISLKGLISKDPLVRRKAQKALVYSLPFRAVFIFVIFYFIKLGFLDGRAGLQYCIMKFTYELMITSKVKELKEKNRK